MCLCVCVRFRFVPFTCLFSCLICLCSCYDCFAVVGCIVFKGVCVFYCVCFLIGLYCMFCMCGLFAVFVFCLYVF